MSGQPGSGFPSEGMRVTRLARSGAGNASGDLVGHRDPDADRLFAFEAELDVELTHIPLAVRLKLDRCRIKLSLGEWQQLPEFRRRDLLRTPCVGEQATGNYRRMLCSLVVEYTGAEPLALLPDPMPAHIGVPEQLVQAMASMGLGAPQAAKRERLTHLQRFALVALSREGREHRNLGPALLEFGLP
jgi:hypothetical protein